MVISRFMGMIILHGKPGFQRKLTKNHVDRHVGCLPPSPARPAGAIIRHGDTKTHAPQNAPRGSAGRDGGGMFDVEEMRPINELRMRARWKLGSALKATERMPMGNPIGRQPNSKSFWKWAEQALRMGREMIINSQRISAMPDDELAKLFDDARKEARLLHYNEPIEHSDIAGTVVPRVVSLPHNFLLKAAALDAPNER